jgi:hypothetical protein
LSVIGRWKDYAAILNGRLLRPRIDFHHRFQDARRRSRRTAPPFEITGRLNGLDDAEQPQDKDQHQDAAKTDIHDTLLFGFGGETVMSGPSFQSLRPRQDRLTVSFYPSGKCRICLTFRPSAANSATDGGAE